MDHRMQSDQQEGIRGTSAILKLRGHDDFGEDYSFSAVCSLNKADMHFTCKWFSKDSRVTSIS